MDRAYSLIINKIKRDQNLWDLFTKKEEYNPIKLDREGRFGYEFSRYRDVLNPIVSNYLLKNGFDAKYPENKSFAVVLTHDIDDVYVSLRHVLGSPLNFLKHGNISGFITLIKGLKNKKKSPYINFKKIIRLEKKYNAISSFYFLVNLNDRFSLKYKVEDLEREIGNIIDEECEIGYHTGYYIYDNLNEIVKEKKKLEQITGKPVIGARNHVLKFKTPDSWEILAKAGFKYDTSFHYHDMVGFRNGMCHPFQPFNLNKNKPIDIIEIPLIVSDIGFRSFMRIDVSKSWQYIKQIIDAVEKNKGVLSVLWHNWTFSLPVSIAGWFGKDWTILFEKILKYTSEKNAWLTNCKELYEYNRKEGILKPV